MFALNANVAFLFCAVSEGMLGELALLPSLSSCHLDKGAVPDMQAHTSNPAIWEVEARGTEFKGSLDYMRHCFKKKINLKGTSLVMDSLPSWQVSLGLLVLTSPGITCLSAAPV